MGISNRDIATYSGSGGRPLSSHEDIAIRLGEGWSRGRRSENGFGRVAFISPCRDQWECLVAAAFQGWSGLRADSRTFWPSIQSIVEKAPEASTSTMTLDRLDCAAEQHRRVLTYQHRLALKRFPADTFLWSHRSLFEVLRSAFDPCEAYCVRRTNWDVLYLWSRVLEFQQIL